MMGGRAFALVIILGLLAGCQTAKDSKIIYKEVYKVPDVPAALTKCPQVKLADVPNPDTATNQEISEFIAKLYSYNKTCGYSMDGLVRYFKAAKKRLEG